jgi:hypothetical protein
MNSRIISVFLLVSLVFGGCYVPTNNIPANAGENREVQIVQSIEQLKEDGLAEDIAELKANLTAEELAGLDEEKLDLFINNPARSLELMAQEENGEAILTLVDVMFKNGTVDEAVSALTAVAPEIAVEYAAAIQELEASLDISAEDVTLSSRSVSGSKSILGNIPIVYMKDRTAHRPAARGVFASDLEWSTIGWYTGFCVTAILGAYATTSFLPWVYIAGIAALAAGGGSMLVQLVIWRDTAIFDFAEKLANLDGEGATNLIVNSEDGLRVLTISALTATTIALCAISPTGKLAIAFVQSCWDKIKLIIGAVLPAGIVWKLNGIEIASSPVSAPAVSLPPPPRRLKWWEKLLPWNWF